MKTPSFSTALSTYETFTACTVPGSDNGRCAQLNNDDRIATSTDNLSAMDMVLVVLDFLTGASLKPIPSIQLDKMRRINLE